MSDAVALYSLSLGGSPALKYVSCMKPSFPLGPNFGILLLLWCGAWVMGWGAHDTFLQGGAQKNGADLGGLTLVVAGKTEPPSKCGKYGGTITDVTLGDPKTFNIWAAGEASSFGIAGPLYDGLIGQNPYTQQWEGHLADLPQVSADGLLWTFHLKPNLQWSDGQPITADDVIFTVDMIYDEKTQGIMREGMLVDVKDPKTGKLSRQPLKYRKIDERTVEFRFPVRYAPARSMLSITVAPRHKLYKAWKSGQINATWSVSTNPKELVASGIWIMKEYVAGQRVIYARNPHYWKHDKWGGPLPYLEKYVQLIVPDKNTMRLKFEAKECDTLEVQALDYPPIKRGEKTGNYTVYDLGPGSGFIYLNFNLNPKAKVAAWKIKLFQQQKFRQAVSYAINRDLVCINQYRGLAKPMWSPVSPANKTFYNPNVPQYRYDTAKAKALLDEIGVKDNDGNGFREFDGHEVQFNIITNVENEQRKSMCTVITKDLKNIGLNAIFTPINFNKLVTSLDNAPYEWEAVVLGFGGGIEPHDGASIWISSGNQHQWNPSQKTPATPWEAEIDDLFRRGAQSLDAKERQKIYNRWQVIAAEQLPFLYLVVPDSLWAVRNRFGNLKPCPQGGAMWNQDELFDVEATKTKL